MTYLLIVLLFLFFAGVAMTINEGLWSNTITLLCILISGLAAAVTGGPLGIMALERAESDDANAWYFIFACTWFVFCLTLVILRVITDKLSRVRIRFLPVVDKIGGTIMGITVATMLQSFAAFTLLSAPIAASEWDMADASLSQVSAFERVSSPFYTVLTKFVDAEEIDSDHLDL